MHKIVMLQLFAETFPVENLLRLILLVFDDHKKTC